MQLEMQIGKDLIGSIPFDPSMMADQAYIAKKIRKLEEKYFKEIEQARFSPVFYINTVPSKMNPKS